MTTKMSRMTKSETCTHKLSKMRVDPNDIRFMRSVKVRCMRDYAAIRNRAEAEGIRLEERGYRNWETWRMVEILESALGITL